MFLDVLSRVVQEADDVMVVERVEGQTAGAADADEARGAQQTQLVRDGRLGQADERGQVADAALTVRQRIDQPHPGGIAEQLEDIGNGINSRCTE